MPEPLRVRGEIRRMKELNEISWWRFVVAILFLIGALFLAATTAPGYRWTVIPRSVSLALFSALEAP